jgi:hypothetical protein
MTPGYMDLQDMVNTRQENEQALFSVSQIICENARNDSVPIPWEVEELVCS